MKSFIEGLISAALALIVCACGTSEGFSHENSDAANISEEAESAVRSEELESEEQKEENTMKITVGDNVFTAKLADNSSAEALKELLKKGDLTIDMHDYGNFEKVGDIGTSLPQNNEQITTEPGDIILYLGTSITIYYDTNSWNFTRLGKIQNVTQKELKEALGKGNVAVTFSLD